MALIKCSNCGKDISDKSQKCIHCGTKIKKKTEEKTQNIGLLKYVPNLVFSIIFILLIYFLGSVQTRYSGHYSIMEFIEWMVVYREGYSDVYNFLQIFIFGYLMLCLWFSQLNQVTRILARIGYIFILVVELLFGLLLIVGSYGITFWYVIIAIYTLVWIILNFKNKKIIIKKRDDNEIQKLKELKELLDMNAITEEEYNKMKKNLIDRMV